MSQFEPVALFEHKFWLQILGDHARFIYNALSPQAVSDIQQAAGYISLFDQLLEHSRQNPSDQELANLTQEAFQQAQCFRQFKLDLLQRRLDYTIKLDLPPTFINHMVNEIEEYLRILHFLAAGQLPPPVNPLHHHLLWLPDAEGHAATIACELDPVEKNLIQTSENFMIQFQDYSIKAREISGYMRTCLANFPALDRFNRQVDREIGLFAAFLRDLTTLIQSQMVLSTLLPLLPDHMIREECYYLTKLAHVSGISAPDCDPTKPRVEE